MPIFAEIVSTRSNYFLDLHSSQNLQKHKNLTDFSKKVKHTTAN